MTTYFGEYHSVSEAEVDALSSEVKGESEKRREYPGGRLYVASALTNVGADHSFVKWTLCRIVLDVLMPKGIFGYLPHLWTDPHHVRAHTGKLTPLEVHLLDRFRLCESDGLLLWANYDSFGAGIEFAWAQSRGMPIVVFASEETRITRMICGGPGITVAPSNVGEHDRDPGESIIAYDSGSYRNLRTQLENRIPPALGQYRDRIVDVPQLGFGDRIRRFREEQAHISTEEMAERLGFTVCFYELLENTGTNVERLIERKRLPNFGELQNRPMDWDKYINPGMWVIQRIAAVFNMGFEDVLGLVDEEKFRGVAQEDNLVYNATLRLAKINTTKLDEMLKGFGLEVRVYGEAANVSIDEVERRIRELHVIKGGET